VGDSAQTTQWPLRLVRDCRSPEVGSLGWLHAQQTIIWKTKTIRTLLEAKVLITRWWYEYNTIRPHSSPGYRIPVREAIQPRSAASATLQLHNFRWS
jgi:hypothetical protein